MLFDDRQHAGKSLAEKLLSMKEEGSIDLANAVVVALPRGGVPVGYEIAKALKIPLDVCVVRKVGAPFQQELAVAAVAEGGEIVINEDISRSLGISHEEIEKLAQPKRAEVDQRIKQFRAGRPAVDVSGKTAILVDDGLATGATALSAIHVLKKKKAAMIILALPVCPASAVSTFEAEVDKLVVLSTPVNFYAVGQWYKIFDQVSDQQVQSYLQQAGEHADFCA